MATEKTINIIVKKDKADKSVKELNKEVKEVDKSTNKLTDTLDKMSGGAVSTFKGLKGGLKSAVNGFKSLRVAIIGTGIGALLIAIVSLKEAFTSSEEGQNKFAKILGVIGSITGNLSDLLSNLGMKIIEVFENPKQAIKDFANLIKENIVNRFVGLLEFIPKLGKAIKQLWEGDFSDAAKTATDAVGKIVIGVESITDETIKATNAFKEFTAEVVKDAKIAGDIADKRAKADKIERNLLVERAKANRRIAELRFKAEQRDKFSAKERIAFLKEASDLEENITKKEIYAAQLRLQSKIAENALANSTKADLDEEAQLQAKLIDLETKRLNLSKLLESKIQSTSREGVSSDGNGEKERLDAIEKVRADFKKKNLELEEEENLAKLERQYERDLIELERLQATEEQKYELKKYYSRLIAEEEQKIIDEFNDEEDSKETKAEDKRLKDAYKRIKLEEDVANAKENIANRTASLLIELAGRGSKLGKAIAVAQTIRSGIEGVQNAYSTAQKSPITALFPAYPAIQAGLAGAFSAVQVKKILSTQDTVSSSNGGGRNSTPTTTAPSFNLVSGTPSNQIAESINNQNEKPIKAYVVSSEMTSAQELDRNRQEVSSI